MEILFYPHFERSILGTAILSKDAAYRVMQGMKVDHFSDRKSRQLFEYMHAIYKTGSSITITSLKTTIENDGKLAELAELLASVPYEGSLPDLEFNIEQVKDSYNKSKIAHLVKLLSKDLQSKSMNEILQYCFDAINETNDRITYSVGDLLDDFEDGHSYSEILTNRIRNFQLGIKIRGYRTGIPILDHAISGLVRGSYNVIAGTPGAGKTTLAAQIIHNLIKSGKKVGIITLEMSNSEIFDKIQSIEHNIPYSKIANGDLSEIEKQNLLAFSQYLKQSNTFFMEDVEMSGVANVTARIKRLVEIYNIDVLCIDYIGLIGLDSGNATVSDKIKEISTTIRLLLKKYRIPGLILAQLVKSADGQEPQLGHIRDSGGIAQDAHTAIFAHALSSDNPEDQRRNIYIRKNRFGHMGTIPMKFNGISFVSESHYNQETIRRKQQSIDEFNRYT